MSGTEQIGAAWRRASQRIERLDARRLLEHVGECSHADLIAHHDRKLSIAQSALFADLLKRREAGEPLAYLLGSAFFKGLEFTVSPTVLIPRSDTEVLVDEALKRAQDFAAPRIVDLGTGSGIIAILLARLCPFAAVTAVDVSAAALECARVNAQRHRVEIRFLEGEWYEPLGAQRFNLIVSNPPYVADGDPHLQQNGLPFEPQNALSDGVPGGDGMACIRTLILGAHPHLLPGGWLLIEHGYDQAVEARTLLYAAGFAEIASWRDAAAIERVSGGRRALC